MFRFIHAADPHIDSPLRGLEAHEGAPVELLRGATRRAFENLVQLAIDEAVDFVVIAGDVYDGDWKDYSTGLFFRGQMARLNEQRISVFIIAGNHDAASVISKKISLPENVRILSTRKPESVEVEGLPVVIHGQGFPHRAVPENLAENYPDAVEDKFNLGLLHTSLTGRPGHDTYAPCSEQDLLAKKYDYWALGHIHQPEIVNGEPWIVFAGNIQGRHVREAGERGCYLVEVDDTRTVRSMDWRTLDVVRWAMLEVKLAGVSEMHEVLSRIRSALVDAMALAEGRLLAVRLILKGATALHGVLHADPQQVRAEVLGLAQDLGEEAVWIERIKLQTNSLVDLDELAERDELTRVVLQSLSGALSSAVDFPGEVKDMLEHLPLEIRKDVDLELAGEVADDVRSIILQSLESGGHEEA